jgi:hypothetical protein
MLYEIGMVLALCGPAASSIVPIATESKPTFTVARCALEYKSEVRRAYFAAIVQYRLLTNALGEVTSVSELESSRSAPPFRPVFKSLEKCLKSWKLEPSTEYIAELRWGSAHEPSWRVCRSAGGCIALSEAP